MTEPKGRAFWERAVHEVEAGVPQTQVAAKHGVAASTVGYWVRRLRRERMETDVPVGRASALVPVRVVGTERHRIEVAVGGARVQFEEGTDPSYVAAIARALSGC
jgi:transposase-like protein